MHRATTPAMTDYNPHKPKISYDECDRLVCAYRDDNDEVAAAQLLDAFEGYTKKFYNVIRKGKVLIKDRDVREFVKLYMRNEYDRKHVHQYRHMPTIQQSIYMVAESIRQLHESYSDGELMNEIVVAVLTMAKRYQSPDGNPRFHTYMMQAFHYQLRRQLQTLVSDPSVFKFSHTLNFNENYHESDISRENALFDVDIYPDGTSTFTIDEPLDSVNDNWILGFTTGEEYKDFSIMERKILKMYYLDDMSDQEIASELGTCRATVNRRRNKVIRQLSKIFKEKKRIHQE